MCQFVPSGSAETEEGVTQRENPPILADDSGLGQAYRRCSTSHVDRAWQCFNGRFLTYA